jgi:hypothetical protein
MTNGSFGGMGQNAPRRNVLVSAEGLAALARHCRSTHGDAEILAIKMFRSFTDLDLRVSKAIVEATYPQPPVDPVVEAVKKFAA